MEKPARITTAITKLLEVDYPIIAAPMFLISDAKLLTAVCKAGATGAMPALNFRPTSAFREEIKKIKAATSAPFGVNIIVQESNKLRDEQVEICLEEGVAYLITSLGNPSSVIKRAHQTSTKVFCDVVSEKHAKKVVDAGADALVAICCGAGGHSGTVSPFALVPGLKKRFQVPVIAGGSIVNGQTMLAALALGADAVYLGTRFIASEEANAPEVYKKAILNAAADDIVSSDRVDGFPGNFIRTKEFDKLVGEPKFVEKAFRLSPRLDKYWRLLRAAKTLLGEPEKLRASYKTTFSAGHGVALIDNIQNIETIITSLVSEYWDAKKELP